MTVDEAIDTLAALEPLERAKALERLAQRNAFSARHARALAEADRALERRCQDGSRVDIYDRMLACLKEIQVHYSPFGRPGALIDETIRDVEGRR
jgi:hypothetical protein